MAEFLPPSMQQQAVIDFIIAKVPDPLRTPRTPPFTTDYSRKNIRSSLGCTPVSGSSGMVITDSI